MNEGLLDRLVTLTGLVLLVLIAVGLFTPLAIMLWRCALAGACR
jgi:hypothetical protein